MDKIYSQSTKGGSPMKKEYTSPRTEVIVFEAEDTITTSMPVMDTAPELPFIFFD